MSRLDRMLIACLFAAGCAVTDEPNVGTPCSVSEDCPAGQSCYRGFCISGAGGECSEEGMRISCYTGPEGTAGVGLCSPGERICSGGTFGPCLGQVVPALEVCNGLDDDCDGLEDEFDDDSCETRDRGACREGVLTCRGASAVCESSVDPTVEACDGTDEDCDGTVDEETAVRCYPDGEAGCTELTDGTFECQGICRPGMRPCADGALGACADAVVPMAGDGCTTEGTATDDDCDGMIDEDCECTSGETQDCYGGPTRTAGIGECTMGTQTCTDTGGGVFRFGACEGEVRPTTETCGNPGADDDCNGVDDDVPMLDDPCTDTSAMGVCRNGTRQCVDGALACVTPDPTAEVCNALDDDCDGSVDEGFDTLTDPDNCGMCGVACTEGFACCNGSCVDTSTNTAHCGGCGTDCGEGLSCCGGTCAGATEPECTGCATDCSAMGQECCSGSCVDTESHVSHCGGCGIACDPGELCCGGTCVPNDSTNCNACGTECTADQLCCTSGCVANDEMNCNACGESCLADETCCPDGCTDTAIDPENCGGCGIVCGTGQHCSGGLCCNTGLTNCGGECVNTSINVDHCGGCGSSCSLLGLTKCCGGECKGALASCG